MMDFAPSNSPREKDFFQDFLRDMRTFFTKIIIYNIFVCKLHLLPVDLTST